MPLTRERWDKVVLSTPGFPLCSPLCAWDAVPPLLVRFLPQGAEVDGSGQGCRLCTARAVGLTCSLRSAPVGANGAMEEPLCHCYWASGDFSAIIYSTSFQSQSYLWRTWCLFRSLLSKRELWGLIIFLGHQWNLAFGKFLGLKNFFPSQIVCPK